jgi:dTDP-4-dehydrorhamnose 3,5-epimerase
MPVQSIDTTLTDARIFVPDVFEDSRGYFKETYSQRKYHALGLLDEFVQDSVSFSTRNVIRGLHGDVKMSKLVQVLRGAIWDVIVDVRRDSPTFGKWEGFDLTEHNHRQLYIPKCFLHGFIALSDVVVFNYKHSSYYDPSGEFAARWDDPTLAIPWPLDVPPIVSDKDRANPDFAALQAASGEQP